MTTTTRIVRAAALARLCRWHGADDTSVNLTTRASGFSVTMTAFDDGGQGADNSADNGGHGGGQRP